MSVLIVDDCALTLSSLQALLQIHGFRDILTAQSGPEALERLNEHTGPDGTCDVEVMLLDVTMPGLDGIEVCRRVKASPHLADIPVLVVTGGADEAVLRQSFEAGAVDFLAKPLQPTELMARLRSALTLKRQFDRVKEQARQLERSAEELRRANQELERLAIRDELTGVGNRRFFNLVLDQEWSRAAREVLPLSLILLDIDHFKVFNDLYGHPRGDECLKVVAQQAKRTLQRAADYIARYGGEEFAILLPHTPQGGAVRVAERVRFAVDALKIENGDGYVTISLGVVSVVPERRLSPSALVDAADAALYRAKREGRNRVCIGQVYDHRTIEAAGPHWLLNGQS